MLGTPLFALEENFIKNPKRRFAIPTLVLAVTFVLFRFVLFIGYVPTESMEPTLKKGSVIVGSRLLGELDVGDIIVFRHEGKLLVKRIAALGGQEIVHNQDCISIPQHHLYVLGDNGINSSDSRTWSDPFVPEEAVVAIILGYS